MSGRLAHTKGQIDRAGSVLRRVLTGVDPVPSAEELAQATVVAETFRQAHRAPMVSARLDLRACIENEGLAAVELGQRLKRMPTTVDKLRRLPTMNLSSVQDLGGCRAVFATQAEIARVQERFMTGSRNRNGVEDTVRDYVARPRDSGYRAVHLWTRYGGLRVEVQLRTQLQHAWAAGVEDLTALTGIDYKNGDGSPQVHAWLRLLSESYACADAGVTPDRDFQLEFAVATTTALSSIIQEASRQKDSHG